MMLLMPQRFVKPSVAPACDLYQSRPLTCRRYWHDIVCERDSSKRRQRKQIKIRGLLAEFGVVVPQGMARLMNEVKMLLASDDKTLPPLMQELTQRLLSHLQSLDRQTQEIDNQIKQLSRQSSACRTLEQIPGIGPITATALVATVGNTISEFKNGRQLAAFLGVVPRQHSSGGKERLLGISKRGDGYLRRLLIHGARSVLHHTLHKPERSGTWLAQ